MIAVKGGSGSGKNYHQPTLFLENIMTEQAQQPIVLNLRMTVEGLNYTLGALAKGPFEQVSDLISDLRTQALTQLEAMKSEVEAAQSNDVAETDEAK